MDPKHSNNARTTTHVTLPPLTRLPASTVMDDDDDFFGGLSDLVDAVDDKVINAAKYINHSPAKALYQARKKRWRQSWLPFGQHCPALYAY
ncbi:hypothetical protein OAM67_01805 [bacterium]|nr:hypothetical protein [bacterium]